MHIPAGSEFKTVLGIVSTFGFALSCPRALADEPGGLSPVVNPISKGIYDLHMVILWVCVAIVIGVFGAMIYSIIRHRKSRGEAAANFHKNPTTEYIWAGIPFAILILMAIPATKTLLTLQDSRQADLSIKVTGYECKWKYNYLEENIGFFSALPSGRDEMVELSSDNETEVLEVDNPIVVPTHQKIRFFVNFKRRSSLMVGTRARHKTGGRAGSNYRPLGGDPKTRHLSGKARHGVCPGATSGAYSHHR